MIFSIKDKRSMLIDEFQLQSRWSIIIDKYSIKKEIVSVKLKANDQTIDITNSRHSPRRMILQCLLLIP